MSLPFSKHPSGTIVLPTPFSINIQESALTELKTLLKYSKLAKPTFENTTTESYHGVSREWLQNAKATWEGTFNWRKSEEYINSFPNFITEVAVEGQNPTKIHFAGLFSERKDAVPLILLHGWPGSFLEFLPILSILKKDFTPETLPYHVIVPSLPGFAFSDSPPLDRDFDLGDVAAIMNGLMVSLGFGDGYVAQGGDIGSKVSRILGAKYPSCKAVHLNFCAMTEPAKIIGTLDEIDLEQNERAAEFRTTASGYAIEHATRGSTIGLVLASNPLATLAWIGEKFLEWTDQDPPLDTILEAVSLYWLTDTFPSSIYQYRQSLQKVNKGGADNPDHYIPKPLGFSAFPKEIVPVPKAWAATTGNLVFYRRHDAGAHFAALEQPGLLLQDIKDFVDQVWK